jgi:hypothetical protein
MKYYILKSLLIYDGISDEKFFCPRSLATAVKILHSLFIEVCTLYTVVTYQTIPSREWFTQSQSQEGLVDTNPGFSVKNVYSVMQQGQQRIQRL